MKLPAKDEMREDGFTMVEILVVIIIIGILAAVAIPIFLNQRRVANDTALTSDIRSIAMNYETWRAGDGNDDEALMEITNNHRAGSIIVDEEADYIHSTTAVNWNTEEKLPDAVMSRGSFISFTLPVESADREHVEGQYCLIGTNPYSNYNYKAGSGNPSNYVSQLFYDSARGGVKTMQELAEGYDSDDPESSSCYFYIEAYKAATSG